MKPVRSHSVRNMEKVEVDAAPEAAVLEIRTRNPEMTVDWDPVWRERGFLKVHDLKREIEAIAQERYARNVEFRVKSGLRVRDLHKEKGNVFGRIAFDKFLYTRQRYVKIDAAPKFGVQIDVRIHPPEIRVETNFKWERD
ncbi:DUF6470 family protein [Thermobacillus sp. ZCTH02-B1]|uniref:DUF6470 family protein n=1 Tax=Thermobacillus sp. ZCTH02-B1 TaxID=1858795 RepID=UPI0025EE75AE|nr:DUF6470 family protein [Thermobacillus sp. ZCTH02-B1]